MKGLTLLKDMGVIKKPIEDTINIVDQLVTDKDEAARLKAQIYITELQTSTIPVVDAFHKMGRLLTIFAQLWFYFYCVSHNIEITKELVAGVSGVAGAYTLIKGRGR